MSKRKGTKKMESTEERRFSKQKNPDWKVLVTENGFVRINKPFSQQVEDLVKEICQKNENFPGNRSENTAQD